MRAIVETAIGVIGVEGDADAVTSLYFPGFLPDGFAADAILPPVMETAVREIRDYLDGAITRFSVPVDPGGDGFRRAVWDCLLTIGYGQLMTYGEVAAAVGSPGGARAVGMACRTNPIPLIIPCHRVVGANGKLTGFSGGGLDVKQRLLNLEGARPLPAGPGRHPATGSLF